MKRILSLLVCLLLFGFYATFAQDVQIRGTVTSSEDGSTLPGVYVKVKGTNTGTATGIDGKFQITAPGDATLVFTFIGFKDQEVALAGQSELNITLVTDVTQVEEVVVTAMGIKRETKTLQYAAQGVNNEELTSAAQPTLSNSLQGKVAGITVSQSSGMPGSSSLVSIRGAKSIQGNNQPLLVVDGLPVENGAIFAQSATVDRVSGSDGSSRMNDINPEDIESIEVLKGPAASALYGLRASNGVIYITTKSGSGLKAGEGDITFSTSYTADKVTRLPNLQDTYAQGSYGVFQQGTSRSYGPPVDSVGTYTNIFGNSVEGKKYDNVTPFFKTGNTYTADLQFTRGSEMGNFSASMGYLNQSGVITNSQMTRYSGRINFEVNINKKVKVGANALYTRMEIDKVASGSNVSNPLFTVYYAPKSFDLWGNPYSHADDPYAQYNYRATMDNPRWSLANNSFGETNDRAITAFDLGYTPWEFLTLKYKIGVDFFTNNQTEVYELGSGQTAGRTDPPSGGSILDYTYTQREINSNLMAIFTKEFGDINANIILGNEIYNNYNHELYVAGTGFSIGGFHNMANTSSQVPTQNYDKRRTVGFYGSLQLGYKTIITLTATGRNDIVSYLAKGNRSFFYPSIGGSFIFTELLDIPKNILSFGKLRASWTKVGQAIDNSYGTQNVFIQGGASSGYLTDGISMPLGGINGFTQYDYLYSKDLKPALSSTVEIGADLRFYNNRIGIDVAYFTQTFNDQIFNVPVAASTGYTAEYRNAGKLKTTGNEIVLNLVPVQIRDFKWDITMNFTRYRSKVVNLAEGVETIYLGGFETPSIRAIAGNSYPSIYGIGYTRDDAGNIVVLDDPGSPYNGMPIADEQAKKIGDVEPDFLLGFTNTISYKGISISAFIDWKQGGQMYSGNNMLGRLYGMLDITEDRTTPVVLDAVKGYTNADGEMVITGKNDIAIIKDQRYWDEILNGLDEAHVFETSYVRFRELSVSYDLPSAIMAKTFIKRARISFVARNLALWTSYPNFDPEVSTTGATNGQGIEYVAFPQTRSFGGKLSFTF
jgi:TonB-linked SusC/RagA family outer membrane protein